MCLSFIFFLCVSLSCSVRIHSSAERPPSKPSNWLHWPCLRALIVSFGGLKDARWEQDVLKRQTVKPVCDWQITSLAFQWLAKTLNKLSMCSTARWIVHWRHCWIWMALKDAAKSVCACVCIFSVQWTQPSSQWQDRGRSAFTYRTTHLRKNSPLDKSPFSLSTSPPLLSLSPSVSEPDIDPPELLHAPSPLFFFCFCSLTLPVSFYIVLSVKIPCGRAVSCKHRCTEAAVQCSVRRHWCARAPATLPSTVVFTEASDGNKRFSLTNPPPPLPPLSHSTHTQKHTETRALPNALFSAAVWWFMKGVSHSRQIVLFGMLHFINLFSILISLHPLLPALLFPLLSPV